MLGIWTIHFRRFLISGGWSEEGCFKRPTFAHMAGQKAHSGIITSTPNNCSLNSSRNKFQLSPDRSVFHFSTEMKSKRRLRSCFDKVSSGGDTCLLSPGHWGRKCWCPCSHLLHCCYILCYNYWCCHFYHLRQKYHRSIGCWIFE